MGFLKKLFKSKSSFGIDSDKLELYLESVDFYNEEIPPNFYTELFEIYTVNAFNKADLRHIKAYNEFKEQVDELSQFYNRIVSSRFEKESLNSFLTKFEDLTSKEYELAGVKTLMAIYWAQPIRKTSENLKNCNEKELITVFEEFYTKYKNYCNQFMLPPK